MRRKRISKKKNKNIRSEFAIGIVMIIAAVIGGLIWMGNKKSQAGLGDQHYIASLSSPSKPQANALNGIVFLGDSITALEDWNTLFEVSYIINAGISGNTTDDIIARLSPAISSKPPKLFLMIGINDLVRGKDVSYVLANYKTILDRIKVESPKTTIYIQSVLPIDNSISKIGTVDSRKIIALNENLKELADNNDLTFIDLYPSFSEPSNKMIKKYAVDGVHLSHQGYEVWKESINQYIK